SRYAPPSVVIAAGHEKEWRALSKGSRTLAARFRYRATALSSQAAGPSSQSFASLRATTQVSGRLSRSSALLAGRKIAKPRWLQQQHKSRAGSRRTLGTLAFSPRFLLLRDDDKSSFAPKSPGRDDG